MSRTATNIEQVLSEYFLNESVNKNLCLLYESQQPQKPFCKVILNL